METNTYSTDLDQLASSEKENKRYPNLSNAIELPGNQLLLVEAPVSRGVPAPRKMEAHLINRMDPDSSETLELDSKTSFRPVLVDLGTQIVLFWAKHHEGSIRMFARFGDLDVTGVKWADQHFILQDHHGNPIVPAPGQHSYGDSAFDVTLVQRSLDSGEGSNGQWVPVCVLSSIDVASNTIHFSEFNLNPSDSEGTWTAAYSTEKEADELLPAAGLTFSGQLNCEVYSPGVSPETYLFCIANAGKEGGDEAPKAYGIALELVPDPEKWGHQLFKGKPISELLMVPGKLKEDLMSVPNSWRNSLTKDPGGRLIWSWLAPVFGGAFCVLRTDQALDSSESRIFKFLEPEPAGNKGEICTPSVFAFPAALATEEVASEGPEQLVYFDRCAVQLKWRETTNHQYDYVLMSQSKACHFRIVPNKSSVDLTTGSKQVMVEGYIDGPAPLPADVLLNEKGETSIFYGNREEGILIDEFDVSVGVGFKSEGTPPDIGAGPAWAISMFANIGMVGRDTVTGFIASTLTFDSTVLRDGVLEVKSNGVAITSNIVYEEIAAEYYIGTEETPTDSATQGSYIRTVVQNAQQTYPMLTSPGGGSIQGKPEAYTPESWTARMREHGVFSGGNYVLEMVDPNAVTIRNRPYLEYTWAASGGNWALEAGITNETDRQTSLTIEGEALVGAGGGFMGGGATVMAGFKTEISTTNASAESSKFSFGINSTAAGVISESGYQAITFRVYLLKANSQWIKELRAACATSDYSLQEAMIPDPEVTPSECWKMMYVVTSITKNGVTTNYPVEG